MTENAMRILSFVPIVFLVNAYWMLSNRQIFENVTNKLSYTTEEMESSHDLLTLLEVKPSTPILLFCIVVPMIAIIRAIIPERLRHWGYTISSNILEVDENLPDFFNALKISDKKWFLRENEYSKDKYAFMVANKETMRNIQRYPGTPDKPISNIAFYWPLANPYYQRNFNYFPVMLEERSKYIVDDDSDEDNDCEQSDFVCFMLNLAYLKEEYA